MCGRYSFIPGDDFYDRFGISNRLDYLPVRYNVAPGQMMPVIIRQSPNQAVLMKWGLIPFWAKDPKIGYQMINARAETLLAKPSFRKPLMSQRCLVPVSGFYEWQKLADGSKQPFYIHPKQDKYFSLAGLWDIWKDSEGKEIKGYTIITVTPNQLLTAIHNRMPAILLKEDEKLWLDKTLNITDKLTTLLKPLAVVLMRADRVSSLVNNPANDNEKLINPI